MYSGHFESQERVDVITFIAMLLLRIVLRICIKKCLRQLRSTEQRKQRGMQILLHGNYCVGLQDHSICRLYNPYSES